MVDFAKVRVESEVESEGMMVPAVVPKAESLPVPVAPTSTAVAVPTARPQLFLGRPIHVVAAAPKPPETAPMSQADWDGMSIAERAEILEMLAHDIANATQGVTIKIPVMKYPGSGTMFWDVPGSENPVKVFEFVIMDKAECRVFYPPRADGGITKGELPTCASSNMIMPDEDSKERQASTCAECQWSKWKSGKGGEGQACKVRERLHVVPFQMRDGEVLLDEIPVFLSLPPTALGAFGAYIGALRGKGMAPEWYKTKFSLKEAVSKAGDPYSGLVAERGEKIILPHYLQILAMKKEFAKFLSGKSLLEDIKAGQDPDLDDAPAKEAEGIL